MTTAITGYVAEYAFIFRFMEGFKNLFGDDLVIVSHGDKPDFEMQNQRTGEKFGVEVTGLYQNEREAKINFSRELNWEEFSGSWEELIGELNDCLAKKAVKANGYQYNKRILLAIYVGSLVYNEVRDFENSGTRIVIPENIFSEIWLMLRDSTGRKTELKALKLSTA